MCVLPAGISKHGWKVPMYLNDFPIEHLQPSLGRRWVDFPQPTGELRRFLDFERPAMAVFKLFFRKSSCRHLQIHFAWLPYHWSLSYLFLNESPYRSVVSSKVDSPSQPPEDKTGAPHSCLRALSDDLEGHGWEIPKLTGGFWFEKSLNYSWMGDFRASWWHRQEQIQRTSAPSRPEDARPIQRRPMTTSWEASAVPCPFGIGASNFHA